MKKLIVILMLLAVPVMAVDVSKILEGKWKVVQISEDKEISEGVGIFKGNTFEYKTGKYVRYYNYIPGNNTMVLGAGFVPIGEFAVQIMNNKEIYLYPAHDDSVKYKLTK